MPKETFQKFLDARYPGVGDFNEATSTALGAGVEMEAAYDAGVRAGGGSGGVKRAKDDLTMDRSDFSGGGVKVLKKGDAGHGSGKKRRRY